MTSSTDSQSLSDRMRDKLIAGYRRFRSDDFAEQKALYERLGTKGQNPEVMLISCADSRVDPTDIFHAYPGEMFVLRNVANIVPRGDLTTPTPGTGAALQYAVNNLKVKTIVVMGHESCGGVAACYHGMGDDQHGHVGHWVSHLNPVRERVIREGLSEAEALFEMELEGVRESLRNLMTFDFIAEAVKDGDLVLQGAYFSIINAKLMLMGENGAFSEVSPDGVN